MRGEVSNPSRITPRSRKRPSLDSILIPPNLDLNMEHQGKQDVVSVGTTATQMCCIAQPTISNVCIADAWVTTKGAADWLVQTEGAQRRLPGIDVGQVLVQLMIQKGHISTLL